MPNPNPFRQLHPGEKLRGLPSEPWNRMLDGLKRGAPKPIGFGNQAGPVEILIKNVSGGNLDRFSVLGIGDPSITYASNPNDFWSLDLIDSATPSASGPFVITQEPLEDDQIGRARLLGLTRCYLNISDSGDTHASPTTSTAELTTGTSGPALILSKQTGTGTGKWGVVNLLGQNAAAPTQARWVRFELDDTLDTTDASQADCPVDDYWGGTSPGSTITVYNLPASSNYIFSGAAGAKGLAVYDDVDDKYWIMQLECA